MGDDEHVQPQRADARNSPKASKAEEKNFSASLAGDGFCYWNDKKYSDGATVCDNHQRFKCWSGKWVDIGMC